MDALFPLKVESIDIPDNPEFAYYFILKKNIICFLFSSETKKEEIKIDYKNNIYYLGEILKDRKKLKIYYIEVYSYSEFEMEVSNKPLFIELNENLSKGKIFLFNQGLLDKNNKKLDKLNCFSIDEEFEIYYRIHSIKNNIDSLKSLINSVINMFKKRFEESNFSFFLTILMNDDLKIMEKEYKLDSFLSKIKNRGDLSKISEDKISKIVSGIKDENFRQKILFIYLILSQNIKEPFKFIYANKVKYESNIDCLDKYKNLFLNSVQLFPKITFLIHRTHSFDEIKIILKCSNSLTDFIYTVNEKKEEILEAKRENKDNILILNEFFDLENGFNQNFDEEFYFALSNLREFEIKKNQNILSLDYIKYCKSYDKKKGLEKSPVIKLSIFAYLLDTKFDNKFLFLSILDLKKNSFNNFEIIELIDIILNYNKLNLNELEDQFLNLILAIKFEKINKKLKPFFSKIKWDKMFEDFRVAMGVITIMLENIKNIYNFEYIFIILDKLISKEKKQDDKEKIQEKNLNNELYKKNIYIIIEKIIKIYIHFLDSIKNEKNDNKIEFVQISSKLIYLYFKFEIKNDFLISIIDKIESELLNDIFISTLDNYEISDFNFKNLITVTIQKEKFEKLYNVILKNNKFSTKFENVLKEFVINDDIEQLLDKNNINYLLLSNLYKLNFLKSNPQSPYTKETITKLRNISNKIINIENISLKEMELLLNDKDRIIFFPLLNVNEYLNKNINKIKDILKIKESHEFLILNDFEKMNFSGQKKLIDCIKIFFEKLENNVISWNIRLEKKLNKIKYLLELFQNLEKTLSQNYFFEKIKESNMDYSLYEQILIFFGDNKGEKINSDIITLFKSYLLLETEYKEKTVVNLVNSYYIFKMIEQNSDLDINNDIKKEINNEIKYLESMEINHKIILLIIQDNIKEIFNCYLKYKEKIKFENNKDNDKNKKNEININNNIFISFLSALGIKEDTIYNYKIDNIIKEIKNKKFIKIISILCKNSDALDFLFSITSKDCRNIQELAGEVHGGNNQNFLSIEELLTIEKIVESFELIKNQILDKKNNNKNEDEIIISNTLNEIDEEDLEKYLNKYQQYKEFFSENLDKKKFTAEVIQKILNKSEFLILNSNINNFKAYYANEEKNNKENYKEFNYDYLIYLRDRALTRSKINDSLLEKEDEFIKNLKEEEKIIFENNKIFVEIVHQIKELIKILDKISQKGFIFYFDNNEKKIINEIKNNNKIISIFKEIENTNYILLLKINIKIEKGNESYKTKFLLNGEEYKNYSDIFEAITKIYENIEIIQKNAYLKKKYINFIHGKQFYSFFNYFLNKNLNENLNYFLNYLTTKENININNFNIKHRN